LDFFLRQIKPPDVQEKYMIEEKETTEHGVTLVDLCLTLDANYANPLFSSRKLGHSSFQEMYLFLTLMFFDRK
jgi:hypothetical protein